MTTILLKWDEPEDSDVISVKIYRSTDSTTGEDGTFSLLDTIDATSDGAAKDDDNTWVVSYEDTNGATTYWYKITLVDASANESDFSQPFNSVASADYTSLRAVEEYLGLSEGSITDTSTPNNTAVYRWITWSEGQIDSKAQGTFRKVRASQEIYDFNGTNTSMTENNIGYYSANQRTDSMYKAFNNRLYLRNKPVVTITLLEKNGADIGSVDSWTTLTEADGTQTGDYYYASDVNKSIGAVDFVGGTSPNFQARSLRVTYDYGYSAVPVVVEQLATMMTCKKYLGSAVSKQGRKGSNVTRIGDIQINKNASETVTAMDRLDSDITAAWEAVGNLTVFSSTR